MLNDAFIKFKEEMARRGLRVAGKIGEGGMGSVYEAFDEALERRAAVKIMRSDAGGAAWRERFRREAKFAAKIIHPGVAQIYQAGELEGLLYYVMEFVDGEPLSAFLKKARFIESHKNDAEDLIAAGYIKRPDPNMPYFLRDLISPPLADPLHLGRVDELISAIADILAAVHALDSVHRDIKPSNIMIASDGRVKLVDFGLVKQAVDGDITQANQFVGTFDYMAPEQFRGKNARISPAGDIYSLGVVYYELAALVKPFEGDDIASLIGAIASKAAADPREYNEKISAARARIILKCLAKEPSERFASAGELASAIKDLKNASSANIIDGIKNFFFGLFSSAVEEEPEFSAGEGFDASARERRTAVSGPAGLEKSRLPDKTEVRSDADKTKISRTLFEEAREEYFKNFVTAAVQEKLKQSYDINSNNIDALLLYCLFFNHGIITRPEFEQKLKLSREGENALDAREKLILEAITAMYPDYDAKSASAAGFRYINLYPEDLLMTVFVSLTEMMQGNYMQALQCCDKVMIRYGDFLLMHLIKADIYAILGEIDRSVEIGKEVIARYPQSANYKFLMIQHLLLYGRLDEADRMISEMTASGGDESDSINYQKSSYYLFCGMVKESMVETRKLIALEENPLFKSYHYYRLYRLYELAGEPEKAAEKLDMANKLSPGHDFKSFDRIRGEMERLSLVGVKFENIPSDSLTEAFNYSKKICFKTLDPVTHVKLSLLSETYYYHLEPHGGEILSCEKAIIYSDYHFKPSPVKKNMVRLESVPVSPFISYKGDIYDAVLKKCQSPNGNYYALVNYIPPQKNGECMFFMAQFESAEFRRDEKTRRFTVKTSEKPNSNASYTGVVISFPANYKAVSVSCAPDETSELNGRIFYYYTKFLFCGRKFAVELELEKV